MIRTMAVGALLLSGCGGSTPDIPSGPTSSAAPLVRGVLLRQGFTLEPAKVTYLDFEVPPRNNLAITVDWTFASNNVIVALTPSECPDITTALAGGCETRRASWAPTFPRPNLDRRKPRVLTYDSINVTVPARLWIANAGATDESGVVDIRYCAVPPDCGQWGMCLACWGG
jgi:hypothetical protein